MDFSIWDQHDLDQYFRQTYVGVEDGGELTPCVVEQVMDFPEGNGIGFLGRVNNNHVGLTFNSPKVKVIVPESTFVNCKYEAVYLSRTTERKWKKGVRGQQYLKTFISTDEVADQYGDRGIATPRFEKDIVQGLFRRSFVSFSVAVEVVSAGDMLSCAFDRHFCVAVKKEVPNLVLYYKGMICGVIKDNNIELEENFTALEDKLIEIMGD